MRKLICLLAFNSFVCLAFCQRRLSIADSIINIIQALPEYKAVQRNADSLQMASRSLDGKYNAGVSVAIEYNDNGEITNKIANVGITEQFDTVTKGIYTIKYDIELKKIISIKKEK